MSERKSQTTDPDWEDSISETQRAAVAAKSQTTADDALVEGDLITGSYVRRGLYNRRTKIFHVLTGDLASDAVIRDNAK